MTFNPTPIPECAPDSTRPKPAAREHEQPAGRLDFDHPADPVRLEQYEIVWVLPAQYAGPVTGPPSVKVFKGQTVASFIVTGAAVTASTTATVTATYPASTSKLATITVTP